jgi:peptidyl-prolyl cis-trans isomerase SurA
MALATRIQAEVSSDAGFAAAARQYSASGSAASGGKIEWLPLANLPPAIAPFVLALAPGEVSDPVAIPNAVAIFQLRAVEETEATAPTSVEVEYAQFFLPDDDRAAAAFAKVRAEVDTCDDLYTVAKGLPETQLQRDTQAMGAVPQDIALQLARLDEGESSTALVFGGNRVFLMLCARRPQMETPPSREEVRQQLFNQRLAAMADGYLADLRANAIIREP